MGSGTVSSASEGLPASGGRRVSVSARLGLHRHREDPPVRRSERMGLARRADRHEGRIPRLTVPRREVGFHSLAAAGQHGRPAVCRDRGALIPAGQTGPAGAHPAERAVQDKRRSVGLADRDGMHPAEQAVRGERRFAGPTRRGDARSDACTDRHTYQPGGLTDPDARDSAAPAHHAEYRSAKLARPAEERSAAQLHRQAVRDG